jgi:hypothetical protein
MHCSSEGLSEEKGVRTLLLEAWRAVGERLPLRIVGDGPLAADVAAAAATLPGVSWLGQRNLPENRAAAPRMRPVSCFPSDAMRPLEE